MVSTLFSKKVQPLFMVNQRVLGEQEAQECLASVRSHDFNNTRIRL
jgi:hypothetical protein